MSGLTLRSGTPVIDVDPSVAQITINSSASCPSKLPAELT